MVVNRKQADRVRLPLSCKLFGAFFLILSLMTGAMFLSRYIFSSNFHQYMRQVELERLEGLVPVLEEKYRQKGGWEFIRKDPMGWAKRLEREAHIRRPPPLPAIDETADGFKSKPRLLLLDEASFPIMGTPEVGDSSPLFPIIVDDTTVGWLGLKTADSFREGAPAALLKRQARDLTILGVVVVAVTALIALLFSRHLLRPVRQLMEGTRALAGRQFAVRIQPSTRDELGRLAVNFNETARTLEEYEQLRKKWLADISHELRTPLAILRGELEALEDGVREMSHSSISSLSSEVQRITKLVEDLHLLSLTESDSLRMERKPCSPRSILERSVQQFQARLQQKRIQLFLMLDDIGGVQITGDEGRLVQVFSNILDNSCKYLREGDSLRIVGSMKEDGCMLRFEDSGPSVSENALGHLFDRLYRVEQSRSRNTGGSGLGLAICRHIVEKHGGTIWAEKSRQKGLCIALRLPAVD